MKEKIGEVFSVTADNAPIPGCTLSKSITADTAYYSLASGTDISAEIYPYFKLFFFDSGEAYIYFERSPLNALQASVFWHLVIYLWESEPIEIRYIRKLQ